MVLSRTKILALATVLLPLSYLLHGTFSDKGVDYLIKFFSYYDEFFVLFCLFFRLVLTKQNLSRQDKWIFFIVIATYLIGLISNIQSHLTVTVPSVFVDMLTMYKPFLAFLLLRGALTSYQRQVFVRSLMPLAKFFIILTFSLAFLSQFVDLGMTSGERYGIQAYYFLFRNHSALGISVIASLLIISASTLPNWKFICYLLLSFVTMFLTTKGIIYSFITSSLFIFIFDKKATFKIRYLVFLTAVIILISTYQIKTYFFDSNSPRMVLLRSSMEVASDYAPLGSGFATFGGEQARQYYSPLYYQYGFDVRYGMGVDDGIFLNDNYLAMILAQTGYLGTILYVIILYMIFHVLKGNKGIPSRCQKLSMAALLMLFVCSIATGLFKSTNGVFLFALLAIFSTNEPSS